MIISRKEFYERQNFRNFQVEKEVEELMSVERLWKEAMADAPFRNHTFLFKEGVDLENMELQEETTGIKEKFPHIKTEGERIDKISEEITKDTYRSVPIFRDSDYPDVIYLDDGFHRIYCAHKLGYKVLRVKSKYGKFYLSKSITINDIPKLLDMLSGMFGEHTLKEISELIKGIKKKHPKHEMLESTVHYMNENCHKKNITEGNIIYNKEEKK